LVMSPLLIGAVVWWDMMLTHLVAGPDRPTPPAPKRPAEPPPGALRTHPGAHSI